MIDHQLYFRKAGPPQGTQDIPLKWGDGTLINFRPRVTGVQQVDEVTVRARDISRNQPFEATESVTQPVSTIGISRSDASQAVQGGTLVVADRPVTSQQEAADLAKAYASHLGAGYLEAEGVAKGNPAIRAGVEGEDRRDRRQFGGTYVISSCTHLFQGTHGYRTIFSTAGRSSRSLVDLMTPKSKRGWGNSVVLGTVTNNQDPEKLGRVRVKYPALGDDAESPWARIASPNAGSARGLLMMPQVGDEVVIGFEHDDVHQPYVLGSLWNGQATPGDDLAVLDGSFSLQSDQKIADARQGRDHDQVGQGLDDRDDREGRAALAGRDVAEADREHDDRRQPGRLDQGRHVDLDRRHDHPRDQVRRRQDLAHPRREHLDLGNLDQPRALTALAMADIIGTGISFPLRVDRLGGLALSSGDTDVQEAIDIILGTAPGERPMRPEFGCGIHNHVFGNIDASTLAKIEYDIRVALDRWEPRIDVVDDRAGPVRASTTACC